MLKKYTINNQIDEENAIKEIIQEIILCALSRANFFDEAAFYGGTALRIFYGLDRFSEDLDFSLIKPILFIFIVLLILVCSPSILSIR